MGKRAEGIPGTDGYRNPSFNAHRSRHLSAGVSRFACGPLLAHYSCPCFGSSVLQNDVPAAGRGRHVRFLSRNHAESNPALPKSNFLLSDWRWARSFLQLEHVRVCITVSFPGAGSPVSPAVDSACVSSFVSCFQQSRRRPAFCHQCARGNRPDVHAAPCRDQSRGTASSYLKEEGCFLFCLLITKNTLKELRQRLNRETRQ